MSVPLEQLPEAARTAWTRLRDELVAVLGDDLVAIWAYGGTVAVEGPPRSADLDTYVIVHRPIDAGTGEGIDAIHHAIAADTGLGVDAWYVLEADARRPEAPRHAYRSDRRDTTWAITRAHWLAGRYAHVFGREPAEIVPPPTWSALEADLDREVEHLERHVAEGDTDPYEATYAILNGSRILRTLATRDPAISKRSAGEWALEHLPVRWHAVLRAAGRAYGGQASTEDTELLATEMRPFVAMVRERLPSTVATEGGQPRWSGY
ncbi:MAG: aminoglycoside adenylyltransferase domain-containing protein [Candidatus Limnocylindria bacterium]